MGHRDEQPDARVDRLGLSSTLAPKLPGLAGGQPMRALLAGDDERAALPLTNRAPVPGGRAAAICPDSLGVHVDLSSCLHRDAPDAALSLAEWLGEAARDATLEQLGATRFVLSR